GGIAAPEIAIARRPVAEPGAAVLDAQRGMQGVALEPAGVLGTELMESIAEVWSRGQGGVGRVDQSMMDVVGAPMLGRPAGIGERGRWGRPIRPSKAPPRRSESSARLPRLREKIVAS